MHELNGEISRPIKIDGLTLAVTASAGIAMAPEHGDDVALLLQRADIAMYLAKERRTTAEVYSVEQDRSMQRWLMLGGLLTHALEDKSELSVMYQPIANVETGHIEQVEALTRWRHPVQGVIPPDEFIGIAEQLGLIGQITDFVLAEGCARLASWRRAGLQIGLAINVSGREFSDASLVDRVARHLRVHEIPPDALTLEVTETEVMADLGQASKVLNELAALGIRIAIDDYGTGYSSLAYLHRLPGAGIEDRPLVRDQSADRPQQRDHRPVFHRDGPLAGADCRRGGGGGRSHLRHVGRRRLRLDSGLLPVKTHGAVSSSGLASSRRMPRIRTVRGQDRPLGRARIPRTSCQQVLREVARH